MRKTYNIYKNVYLMMSKYRNLGEVSKELTLPQFSSELTSQEYIIITGENAPEDIRGHVNNITIFIAPGSDYANKSGEFRQIIDNITKNIIGKDISNVSNNITNNILNNICIITENPLTSHIEKVLASIDQAYYIEHHLYNIFKFNIMEHNLVPKHEIDNVDDMLYQYYTDSSCLHMIKSSDPAVVWIGGRPGMTIKIKQLSETVAFSYDYKICVLHNIGDTLIEKKED